MPETKETVILHTNRGDIKIKLFPKTAPKACENFVRLAEKGYYDGVTFRSSSCPPKRSPT